MKIMQPELVTEVCTAHRGTTVNPVPSIIDNDARRPYASFLFAEGSDSPMVNGEWPMDDKKTQPIDDSKKEIPTVNDELGQKKPGSINEVPRWLVNDDLAACGGVESDESRRFAVSSCQLPVASCQLPVRNSVKAVAINKIFREPYRNDAIVRLFASFSFFTRKLLFSVNLRCSFP